MIKSCCMFSFLENGKESTDGDDQVRNFSTILFEKKSVHERRHTSLSSGKSRGKGRESQAYSIQRVKPSVRLDLTTLGSPPQQKPRVGHLTD